MATAGIVSTAHTANRALSRIQLKLIGLHFRTHGIPRQRLIVKMQSAKPGKGKLVLKLWM
jgi:hypothetical protein